MIKLKCSEHAKLRIRERLGVTDKRKIKDLTVKAYHSGLCMKKNFIPTDTLKWITRKVSDNHFNTCSQWRIYNGHLFLFSKTLTLVTVITIPSNLVPKKTLPRWRA